VTVGSAQLPTGDSVRLVGVSKVFNPGRRDEVTALREVDLTVGRRADRRLIQYRSFAVNLHNRVTLRDHLR